MLLILNGNWIDGSSVGALMAPAGGFSISLPSCNAAPSVSVTLAKAVADCAASKAAANRRPCYVKSLRYYLTRFAKGRESAPLGAITRADVEAWLAQFPEASSRQTWMNRLNALFSWAEAKELIERNPCAKIERITVEHSTPRVLTVDQSQTLLRHVATQKASQLAYLVLGLFAGLRPGEITRLGWPAVNLQAAQVTVEAKASKVRRRRVVQLQPNAVQWLQLAKDCGALLPPSEQSTRRFRRQWAKVLGFDGGWPSDVLRHTAASHLLALTCDAGKVATMLGNSITVLHRHYFGITQPDESARFWAITPEMTQEGTQPK